MAWRPDNLVKTGELDNTRPGWTIGWLELEGVDEMQLYLEWYSNRNGRVVIQSTRLEVERLGERAFELTEDEWRDQARQNSEEMNHFMAQLGDALDDLPPEESCD